jgi:DNA-binding FadR family transcriptional regulator
MLASRANATEDLAALQRVADELLQLIHELDQAKALVLDDGQMQRFESSDIGFHIALLRMAGNRRSLKVVNQARQLIRIFAERRGGHDRGSLERIYRHHYDIVRAIALRKPDEACALVSEHIQNSRRERLEQYERWERDAALDRSRGIPMALVYNSVP